MYVMLISMQISGLTPEDQLKCKAGGFQVVKERRLKLNSKLEFMDCDEELDTPVFTYLAPPVHIWQDATYQGLKHKCKLGFYWKIYLFIT